MKKLNFNFNNDSLQNPRISKARIRGKKGYFKTLVFPERNEMILLDDAIKILRGRLKSVQTFQYWRGGVYYSGYNRSIDKNKNYICVGCQYIPRENVNKFKKVLKLK